LFPFHDATTLNVAHVEIEFPAEAAMLPDWDTTYATIKIVIHRTPQLLTIRLAGRYLTATTRIPQ